MKTIFHIIFAICTVLFIAAPSAKAYLYLTGDANFGPNSITVDTSTGLGWLNLSKTAGLSYDQVRADTQPGGIFSGFRYATVQEVTQLYSSAGLTASPPGDTAGYYPMSSPLIQSFFSLLGTSGAPYGPPEIIALSGDSPDGGYLYDPPSILPQGQYYWVDDGLDNVTYSPSYSFSYLSSWLVESVPEPAGTNLLIVAASVWCGFTLWLRRKRLPI